jgi:hypothetical protein
MAAESGLGALGPQSARTVGSARLKSAGQCDGIGVAVYGSPPSGLGVLVGAYAFDEPWLGSATGGGGGSPPDGGGSTGRSRSAAE